MATDLQPVKSASAAKKYEAFVETQLNRARARIRYLDLGAAALGLLALTLAYGLILGLCDRSLELSPLARQITFGLYAAGGLVYLGVLVLRPLCRQINPYYAARRLEQTIPEAKNSVVNWLDLHQQAIAPAFQSAIGHQAARDLADADLEQAISVRRTSWLGACVAALFICMLVLFVLGRNQFISLMTRAFAPFIEAPIATRTRLLLVRPETGDITIPVGHEVRFAVWVEGRVPEPSSPEALKLLYRYNLSDPYQARPLERGESSRDWVTNLLASEVHNGLWYKIAGGDAETAEYRVQVRSTPLVTGFDVTYHYRPYLGWPDRTTHDQNLQDLRGTEVTLLARTNRTVKVGTFGIDGEKATAAELIPEEPQALRFRLRLEKDGRYRIWFTSVEGESNSDPMAYTIRVLHDHPPQVELTKPGEDIQLPANGVLRLEGTASDDFGIVGLNLRMKLADGAVLQSKPYREGKALRRGDGSYPQMLAYRDFVELDKVHGEDGRALEPLRPGAKLEYWLEGTDNCDYPGPNLGESKHFKVTIRPVDTNQKKEEQQRQEARQEQQQHEKKQDQDLQNQKREARDAAQEQQPRSNDADQPNKQNDRQNEEDLNTQKEKIENAIKKHEQQQKSGENGESNPDKPQESKAENKGDAQSQQQSGTPQNEGKQGREGKPPPNQENAGGKQDRNGEKGEGKRDGNAASESPSGDRGNKGNSQGTERPKDQGMREGTQQPSEPATNRTEGTNQASQSKENSPRPGGERQAQAQDQAKPQSGTADKQGKPDGRSGTAGEKSNTKNDQNPDRGQEKGSKQAEEKNGQGETAAQPKTGHGAAGERPDKKNDQNTGNRQQNRQGEGNKTPQANQKDGSQKGADRKQDSGAEKTEKRESGQSQEGSKQETGQRRGEQREGAKPDSAQKPEQGQQSGNEDVGQKKDEGNPGAESEKRQAQGAGESRDNRSGGSQGESRAGEATPERGAKTGDGKGDAEERKAAGKENGTTGTPENAPKVQEKPSGADKGDSDRAATKTGNKESSQKPTADRSGRLDKSQEKAGSDTGAGRDDKNQERQTKSGSGGDTRAQEKSKDDVSKLAEALKGRDEKGRADARRKLEELRDRAKDPATRKAAADVLDRGGQDRTDRAAQKADGTQPGSNKGRPEERASSKSGEKSPGEENGKGSDSRQATQEAKGANQSDTAKDGPKSANQTDGKGDSQAKPGDRGNQPSSSRQPGGTGAGRRSGDNPTAKAPDSDSGTDSPPNRQPEPTEPATAPNPAYQKRAGELQLEDIKKKINKDVLKQLNMTEEDFQKFVKAYDEMLKRKQPPGAEKENLIGPQKGNHSLPNQGVRAVAPDGQGKSGPLQRLGPALAPPEFRDAYREFSKRISALEQDKDKK